MSDPRPPGSQRVDQLLHQVRWITRTSAALSSAVHVEDVYTVLLSGLLSPLGLAYSRALVFEVSGSGVAINGRMELGVRSAEESEELRQDLEGELEFLERRKAELQGREELRGTELDELRTLELGTQWVTVFQRLGADDGVGAVAGMGFPLRRPSTVVQSAEPPSVFQEALARKMPWLVEKAEALERIPEELQPLLSERFAVLPLHTTSGLAAVVLLDRRFASEGDLTDADMEALDWFGTQAALALQNARLIEDLEKAYRELQTVDQMKSNFISIVSHELRTPLTAIIGFVELVLGGKAGEINEMQRSLLTRVAKNTGHLNNMVNDLIEIAEIEGRGFSDMIIRAIDPLTALFNTMPKLDYRRRDKQVEVEPVFHGYVPRIYTDERALERIFFHLLDNAVKFSPKDNRVLVEFLPSEGGERLAIRIRDYGVGIPQDKLQRIFEQFYQVDNGLTRSHEGLGLGLSVTRMLVAATHGEIQVESRVGEGSVFTVIYPIAPELEFESV